MSFTLTERENKIRSDFADFMVLLHFPEEAIAALLEAYDTTVTNDYSHDLFLEIVENYRDKRYFQIGELINSSVLSSRENGIHEYTSNLIFYMCAVMYSWPLYEEKGISRQEWLDSMADYRCKLYECHDRFDIWGTFVNWFDKWYTADRTTYGKFAFEVIESPVDFKTDKYEVRKGQKCIETHILNNLEYPFSKEAWTEAYSRAEEYFKDKLDGAEPIFIAGSWIFFPKHYEMLPENSNIIQFIKEYDIAQKWESKDDLWRIYHCADCYQDPSLFQEDTLLQREYKKLMMAGGSPEACLGFRLPNSKRK